MVTGSELVCARILAAFDAARTLSGCAEILTQPGAARGDKLRALDADPHSNAGTRQAVLSAPTPRTPVPRDGICAEEEAQGSLAIYGQSRGWNRDTAQWSLSPRSSHTDTSNGNHVRK